MSETTTQDVYINLDDSGKLCKNESLCVYSGIIFLSKKEKDKFITQYRSIINSIKCKYCKSGICNKLCPEIKNTNIKNTDKRRVLNYIKKYHTTSLVINNDKVYKYIINNKSARGRFVDYSIKRMIKEIIRLLILNKYINPYKKINIILNIDEQTTKSNGYYNLKESIIEELRYGISNFNYASKITPIIHSDINIKLSYQDSKKSYVIQASDLLAGTIRRIILDNNEHIPNIVMNTIDYLVILP